MDIKIVKVISAVNAIQLEEDLINYCPNQRIFTQLTCVLPLPPTVTPKEQHNITSAVTVITVVTTQLQSLPSLYSYTTASRLAQLHAVAATVTRHKTRVHAVTQQRTCCCSLVRPLSHRICPRSSSSGCTTLSTSSSVARWILGSFFVGTHVTSCNTHMHNITTLPTFPWRCSIFYP